MILNRLGLSYCFRAETIGESWVGSLGIDNVTFDVTFDHKVWYVVCFQPLGL
jgi:hypothetical protein